MYFRLFLDPLLAFSLLLTVARARPGQLEVTSGQSRPCKYYDINGCSIPFGLPFFYKTRFTPACDRHDVCYNCGVADNISRWRCDKAFRQDTLATCKAQYMTPNIPSPSLIQIFNVDKTETDSHQTHFLRVVELHGMETFQDVLQGEVSALVKVHPGPSFQQFQAWFSRHKVHVRMLAEWVKHLAQYIQPQDMKETWNRKMSSLSQHASGHFQPLHGAGDSDEIDWCGDIDRYLKANNETMPSSSGLLCPDIQYLTCNFFSEIYFLAVWIFGGSGYRQQAEFYCHESWVTKCLPMPPSAVLRFLPHD